MKYPHFVLHAQGGGREEREREREREEREREREREAQLSKLLGIGKEGGRKREREAQLSKLFGGEGRREERKRRGTNGSSTP